VRLIRCVPSAKNAAPNCRVPEYSLGLIARVLACGTSTAINMHLAACIQRLSDKLFALRGAHPCSIVETLKGSSVDGSVSGTEQSELNQGAAQRTITVSRATSVQ
jgi:hypothetical protein